MRQTIPLGRIAGIPVGFNWSLLLVVGLLAWTFAAHEFPVEFPGRSEIVYWAAGIITTAVFFSCLLVHEMAHALVARRLSVRVEGITLWLFGGIARIRGDDMTARSELRIAIAGPLASLVLAGIFVAGGRIMAGFESLEMVAGATSWLGRINLMLALFNLVPAFPMDGGRVMRALLWRRLGHARATSIAVWMGRGFGTVLLVLGLIEAALGNPAGGVWLAFLGWFLSTAARGEAAAVPMQRSIGTVKAKDVMNPSPTTAPAWMTVAAFLLFADGQTHSAYPLREIDGSIVGLATVAGIARVNARDRENMRVREVCCLIKDCAVAGSDELMQEVLARPVGCARGWVLVMNDEGLVGLIGPRDIQRGMDLHEQAVAETEPT